MSRYRFIEAQRDHYPVRLLCQLVAVPASGYYAWQQAQQPSAGQVEPAWAAGAPAQSLRPAHDRFDPRAALRAEPAARPAQTDPGQPGLGQRYHLSAAGQRRLGLLMRLSGYG